MSVHDISSTEEKQHLRARCQRRKSFASPKETTKSILFDADPDVEPSHLIRILTIDGCGLQGISNLLVLDRILDATAVHTGHKPKPCQIFDMVAGIGSGGWLALLLGRLHMDVPSAIDEWLALTRILSPPNSEHQAVIGLFQRR